MCIEVCVLWKLSLTVFWQSALTSCSSRLSNFSRDGWREMVSLLRVKGIVLSGWGLSRTSPGDSKKTRKKIIKESKYLNIYMTFPVKPLMCRNWLFHWKPCGWETIIWSVQQAAKYLQRILFGTREFFTEIAHHAHKIFSSISWKPKSKASCISESTSSYNSEKKNKKHAEKQTAEDKTKKIKRRNKELLEDLW